MGKLPLEGDLDKFRRLEIGVGVKYSWAELYHLKYIQVDVNISIKTLQWVSNGNHLLK